MIIDKHKCVGLESEPVKTSNRKFLIYQMGKVGSSSVAETLRGSSFKTVHTHSHTEAVEVLQRRGGCDVITGFREPLTRTISAYFQNLTNEDMRCWYLGSEQEVREIPVSILIERFLDILPNYIRLELKGWLERYLQSTGLRSEDIPIGESHTQIIKPTHRFWIYKLEFFSDFEESFFRVNSGLSYNAFLQSNVGANKWYSDIYSDFLDLLKISRKDYEAYFLSCDWVRHLYTNYELLHYARRFIR